MRRRDLHRVNPSAAWQTRAKQAADDVSNGKKKPGDLAEVWTDLKRDLAGLSYGKCWYCESRQARSDNAVDHFRPKSKYPWRAFVVANFRFSCMFCNSRRTNPATGEVEGKGDLFPLLNGGRGAAREADVPAEQPVLLDPCVAADVGLMDFLRDGTPCPVQPLDPVIAERVKTSIELYHLDHPELNEQRRVLALTLDEWIMLADRLYPRIWSDPDIRTAYEGFVDTIARHIDDHAELSAFARRMVKHHRSKPWIEQLLDAS